MQNLIKLSIQFLAVPLIALSLIAFNVLPLDLATVASLVVAEIVFVGCFWLDERERRRRMQRSITVKVARAAYLVRG